MSETGSRGVRTRLRPVSVPLEVVILVALLVGAAAVQGLRMAKDRQDRILPQRAARVDRGADGVDFVEASGGLQPLVVHLPAEAAGQRLGMYQILPHRTLVRWIEDPGEGTSGELVIPLVGLEPGRYAITRHGEDARAMARDMDLPPEELDIAYEFELRQSEGN